MKIAIIGAGAMGSIFGGNLSKNNEVVLIDVNDEIVREINLNGLIINENGQDNVYYPSASTNSENLEIMDLIILFVKSIHSRNALEAAKSIIGNNTYLLTLQNGGGHEELLREYASDERILIGTTEDNGHIIKTGHVIRGGSGIVNLGMPFIEDKATLNNLSELFESCGFKTRVYNDITHIIWNKLSINSTLSAVTGLLQCRLGFVYENKYAWTLVKKLVKEFVQVSTKIGLNFSEESILANIKQISINSSDGFTSISVDVREKRKTEVDAIVGYVLKKGQGLQISLPCYEFILNSIHALEDRE